MNRFLTLLGLALSAVLLTALPATAAGGHHHGRMVAATGCYDATPGVVTQYEYNHAEVGMTRSEVACLFGTEGFNSHFLGNDNTKGVVDYKYFDGRTVEILYQLNSPTDQVLLEKHLS